MRESNRLTALAVAKMDKPGRYGDGLGLWLQVSRWGTKSWIFRYQVNGRQKHMGLGPVHTISLADARRKAADCRRLLLDGIDPLKKRHSARQEARLEVAKGICFRECGEKLIASREAVWRNSTHRQQWRNTLAT